MRSSEHVCRAWAAVVQAHQPCCNVPGACTWQSTPRHYAQSAYCTYVQRMQASSVMLCALRLAIAHGRARLHSRCLLRRLRHQAALGLVTHGLASGYACNEHGLFVLWLRDSCMPWLSWHVCCSHPSCDRVCWLGIPAAADCHVWYLCRRLAPIRGIPTKAGMQDPNSDLLDIFKQIEDLPTAPKKFFDGLKRWASGDGDPTWKK